MRRLQTLRQWSYEHTKEIRFFPKLRNRAVCMAQDRCGEHLCLLAAIKSNVLKTLNEWVRNYQVDTDARLGNAGNLAEESVHSIAQNNHDYKKYRLHRYGPHSM